MSIGVYFHIPFCTQKCPYCDFYSITHNENFEQEFVDAVIRNIENHKGISVDTVYFGGGTPSILSVDSYERIFKSINENFVISENCEITIEANPCSIDFQKLKRLRKIGFNRISFGVQSANDRELALLGRTHNFEQAKVSVNQAYDAGFRNISCDLMLGTPEQTMDSLRNSIFALAELPINHISAYILKVEKGTKYDRSEIKDLIADEDLSAQMYLGAVDLLNEKGFGQYEISNFCKIGFESRHNLKYWNCEEYLGIGPSAHSYFNGKRFFVKRDLKDFINSDVQKIIIDDENPRSFDEVAMLRLRLTKGIDRELCREFSIDFDELLPKVRKFEKMGFIETSVKSINFTPKGFLLSNAIIPKILW